MELSNIIEAILFYRAEPLSVKQIAQTVQKPIDEVRHALSLLEERLSKTGLRILINDDMATMGTAPEAASIIEQFIKEELSKELSKASLETLSIILYRGPITRSDIDYIRGVNSSFILRNLLIRGLIEKAENPHDQRSYMYKPTFALFEYLGITKKEDLPEYAETMATLEQFVSEKENLADTPEQENTIPSVRDEERGLSDEDNGNDFDEADIAEEGEMGANYNDNEIHNRLSDTRHE